MTAGSRGASLPFDHLFAEVAAFPLASEAALTDPVTHLEPGMNRDTAMGPATARLWRAAERELLLQAPGVSVTDLVMIRDRCWFGEHDPDGHLGRRPDGRPGRHPDGRPGRHPGSHPDRHRDTARHSLGAYLNRLATVHLHEHGPGLVPRLPEPADGRPRSGQAYAEARRAWMWLTFALPEDLLLATATADGPATRPDLLTPALRRLLSRGFAETHLHVGAALDFTTLWSLLLARLAWPGLDPDVFAAPGAPLREGLDLHPWLLRCATARVVLAQFLRVRDPGLTLTAFLYGSAFRRHVVREAGRDTFWVIIDALGDLARGRLTPVDPAHLRWAYATLVGTQDVDAMSTVEQAAHGDPLIAVLGRYPGSPDQHLVRRACRYLDEARTGSEPGDDLAEVLLWQTVRVRTLLYRHLIQRPLTPGLPWFIRFSDRLSRLRGRAGCSLLVHAAALRSGSVGGLRSLELRTSPCPDVADLRAWLRSATDGPPARPPDDDVPADPRARPNEIGFVFHFVRNPGGDVTPGVPPVAGAGTHADPRRGGQRCRFGTYFTQQLRSALPLARLVHTWPRTLYLVRGLDLCADELSVPAWVFRPVLDYIRKAASSGARYLTRVSGDAGRPVDGVPHPVEPLGLRTTVHAGEDFSHLLTGLRSIHDAVEVLRLREGDRIGHGLALGLDPPRWAAQAGMVAMPLEDRLLDLAWEWTWWTRRGHGVDAARLAFLTRQIPALARRWFGVDTPLEPLQVEQLRADLTDPVRLRAAGFPDGGATPSDRHDLRSWLLFRYLADPHTFRAGRQVVWIDPRDDVDALERIGDELRSEIGRRGIAIEINPTSNLLIGDLSDLDDHPLWRICPPVSARAPSQTAVQTAAQTAAWTAAQTTAQTGRQAARLAITVGSDDPLIFNTDLPMEYQRLYDGLVLAGIDDVDALAWLDDVRQAGLDRRFTTDAVRWLDVDDLWHPENPSPLEPPSW